MFNVNTRINMDTEISQDDADVKDNSSDAEFVPDEEEATDDSDPEELIKPGQKSLKEENKNNSHSSRKDKRRSFLWRYFQLIDDRNKIARCNACARELNCSTINNLKKHLVKIHSNIGTTAEFAKTPEEVGIQSKKYVPYKIDPQKRFRSTVWKYFDVVDMAAKIAACKRCGVRLLYNCRTNLRKHIQRHGIGSESEEEGEAEVSEEQTSPIWAYFKCLSLDQKLAACLICKKRVDYNDHTDLSKHLSRKHPQAHKELNANAKKPRKLMITNNGEIYEIDENVKVEPVAVKASDDDSDQWQNNNDEVDTLETTDYLDENIFDEPNSEPKKRRLYQNTVNRQKEEGRSTQHKNTDDTLDIFGKYIVSLLKKLPKHKSDRLQADFVRQIMEAQNDSENNPNIDSTPIQNTCSMSNNQNTFNNTRYCKRSTQNDRISLDETRVTSNSEVTQP